MSSVFKIYSPADCDFYYDGELQGHIEGNSKKAFRFEVERKGVYRLVFINSEYQTELMMKVSIDADEEREVELDFSDVNEPAIRERERIINAIEHDYGYGQRLPKEIISAISNNGCITIPKGVRKIGERAFQCCFNLTSIIIPDSVTKIGDCAFWGCKNLTSFTVPNSVTAIGRGAFSMCENLTSFTVPNSVTAIETGAFSGCKNLTSFTIPNNVTAIEEGVFDGCERLMAFYGKYASHNNYCLIKDGVLLAFVPAPNDITKYTIPNSITAIGDSAFSGCCLTSITIPNSVTEIGANAFRGCSSLTSIIIPASVTKIGGWAFIDCISLKSVYSKAAIPPKTGGFQLMPPFMSNASDLKIYVPKSEGSTVLEAYKSAEGWERYADIIEEYDYNNE